MRNVQTLILAGLLTFAVTIALAQNNGGGNGVGGGGGGNGGRAPNVAGTILKVSGISFVILDNKGVQTTIATTSTTNFMFRRTPATFQDVVKPGMRVRAMAAPDGTAALVSSFGLASNLSINQLQAFLGATDEEWAILKPRIEKIRSLRDELSGNGGNNGGNNGNNGNSPPTPSLLETTSHDLAAAAFSNVSDEHVSAALQSERDARARISNELAATRKELIGMLTPRQEALLVIVGVID